jgi:hypothetical protein
MASTHLRNRIQAAVDHAMSAHTGPLSVANTITDAVVDVLDQDEPMRCGDPEPHEPHTKLGDGRPCAGVDPAPAGLVDRIRATLEAASTRLVYGNGDDLERAAAEMQREDDLVEQHAAALRRAIGPALRNAETYGHGWIRIDAVIVEPTDDDPRSIYDWTISSPSPTTIVVRDDTTTQENPDG